jgi:hypothetical protein
MRGMRGCNSVPKRVVGVDHEFEVYSTFSYVQRLQGNAVEQR